MRVSNGSRHDPDVGRVLLLFIYDTRHSRFLKAKSRPALIKCRNVTFACKRRPTILESLPFQLSENGNEEKEDIKAVRIRSG